MEMEWNKAPQIPTIDLTANKKCTIRMQVHPSTSRRELSGAFSQTEKVRVQVRGPQYGSHGFTCK